jgi:hypothetical protein
MTPIYFKNQVMVFFHEFMLIIYLQPFLRVYFSQNVFYEFFCAGH